MTRRTFGSILASCALLLIGAGAQATMISAITIQTTENNTQSFDSGESVADAINQFYMGDAACSASLDALDMVGNAQAPCNGANTNIATWFQIEISEATTTFWEFGADWGRGGIAFGTCNGSTCGSIDYPGDYWWNLDWSNTQVIDFPSSGSFTLNLIGFEGCCGGAMSLRYRDPGSEVWRTAAVNVPEPSTLALLGIGLFGMGLAGRRRNV